MAAQETETGLRSTLLCSLRADLEPPQDIGARQIYNVKGGEFEGPELRGRILSGGGDWLRVGANGISKLDVRATLETDDGALIFVYYEGRIRATDAGLYFRTTPYFETSAEKYDWLNGIVSVGVNKPAPQGQVAYDVYRIL